MSDKTYATIIGVVQKFGDQPAARERDVNGKKVMDVTVRAAGSQKLVSITIWPEFQLERVPEKGDLVWADGEFTSRTYQTATGETREGLQISATSLGCLPAIGKAAREVVQAAVATAAAVQQTSQVGAGQTSSVPF